MVIATPFEEASVGRYAVKTEVVRHLQGVDGGEDVDRLDIGVLGNDREDFRAYLDG